jgi:hypothetical protein
MALLIAAAVGVVVASRNHRQPLPPPDVPVAQTPAEVRVKAVERKPVRPMGSDPMDAPNEYYFKHWPPNNGNKCPENP